MTFERLTYQILPFEILYQVKDNFGKWPGESWKLHRGFNTIEARAEAYFKLETTQYKRFKLHTNIAELKALKLAEERNKPSKLEPSIPDIPPEMDVITYADQAIDYLGKVSFRRCQEYKTLDIDTGVAWQDIFGGQTFRIEFSADGAYSWRDDEDKTREIL